MKSVVTDRGAKQRQRFDSLKAVKYGHEMCTPMATF